MKSREFATLTIINLGLIIILGGCAPAIDLVDSVTTSSPPPLVTTEITARETASPTIVSHTVIEDIPVLTPTATQTPLPILTTVATLTPFLNDSGLQAKTCATPAKIFNIAETLGIRSYAHLTFQGEDTILFDGWANRPPPDGAFFDPAKVTPSPSPFSSARVLLKGGQVNLESGLIMSRTLAMPSPFATLDTILELAANEARPIDRVDILSQSPNRQWQLVQINDWFDGANGIWLMSDTEIIQLVPYVPVSSTWEWAEDNSILWYTYSVYEFGFEALLIGLEYPPLITHTNFGTEYPLDATYYRLAFSPATKTIFSTSEPTEPYWGIDPNKLYIINADDIESHTVQEISGLTMPVWNEATQSFILMVQKEDGTDFVDLDGNVLVHVPESIAPFTFALSASGRKLTIGYGSVNGIRVYECSD